MNGDDDTIFGDQIGDLSDKPNPSSSEGLRTGDTCLADQALH